MKLFVVSDIHSFYAPLIEALNKAGFDPNNKDHWLISCGDCFDRGPESVEVLHYLMQLERKILIKGNHDLLLKDLCDRGFPYSHDKSNGTVRTVQDFGGSPLPSEFEKSCQITWDKTAAYRDLLINYFETEKYIFVHSWIPLIVENDYPKYYTRDREYHFNPDWRTATEKEWDEAMWGNPFEIAAQGLNQTGKTIVFGHWHCSTGHKMLGRCKSEFDEDAIWEPCFAEGIIGIDRCTAHTGECNVVILEDNFI